MRGVVRVGLALAVIVCGCSGVAVDEDAGELVHDAGRGVDAALETPDAGALAFDGGETLETDAGERDAGRIDVGDAGTPDAGIVGECDLYTQTGCGPNEACRRPLSGGVYGPPRCERAGTIDEGELNCRIGPVGDRIDGCEAELYCATWNACVRYCDPRNPVCPPLGGTPASEWGCVDWCTGVPPFCGRVSTSCG